jgi:hypothetical protein
MGVTPFLALVGWKRGWSMVGDHHSHGILHCISYDTSNCSFIISDHNGIIRV